MYSEHINTNKVKYAYQANKYKYCHNRYTHRRIPVRLFSNTAHENQHDLSSNALYNPIESFLKCASANVYNHFKNIYSNNV